MKYSVWLATYQLYAIGDLFSSHHDHRRTNNPRAFCSKMAPSRSLNFIVCASTLLFITNGSSLLFLIRPAHLIVAFICREIQDSFHAFFNVNSIEFHIDILTTKDFISIVYVYNLLWKRVYMYLLSASNTCTTTRDCVFCIIWKRFLFLFAGTGWTVNLTFSRNLTYVSYDFIFKLPTLIIIKSLQHIIETVLTT